MNVFGRVKPLDALLAQAGGDHGGALKKTLGVWGLTALGIGAIIGTGIFVLTGKAAATSAGPAIVLSFVIAGIVSTLAALCYAELLYGHSRVFGTCPRPCAAVAAVGEAEAAA